MSIPASVPTWPAVGDRITYRDPEAPTHPLSGEVVDVTQHAVHVRYDHMWPHHSPALIGVEWIATTLTPERSAAR